MVSARGTRAALAPIQMNTTALVKLVAAVSLFALSVGCASTAPAENEGTIIGGNDKLATQALPDCTPAQAAAETDIIADCFSTASTEEPMLGWTGNAMALGFNAVGAEFPARCQDVHDRVLPQVIACMANSGHAFTCYRVGSAYSNGILGSETFNHIFFGVYPVETTPNAITTTPPVAVVDPWAGIPTPVAPADAPRSVDKSMPRAVANDPPPPPVPQCNYDTTTSAGRVFQDCCESCLQQGSVGFDAYYHPILPNSCTCK